MLGGLYGDLPPPSTSDSTTENVSGGVVVGGMTAVRGSGGGIATNVTWSNISTKLTPPPVKKPGIFAAPTSVLRNQSAGAKPKAPPKPVVPVLSSRWIVDEVPDREIKAPSPPPLPPALVGASVAVEEEYDPAKPNDYDDYCRDRRRRKMEEEMRREMERRRQEEDEREKEREFARQRETERQTENEKEAPAVPLNISGEEAWKRRGMLSAVRPPADIIQQPRSPSPPANSVEGGLNSNISNNSNNNSSNNSRSMTAAQRMMARMGWKEGQGLGKQEQGITTPLMAKKTDKRAGVIVNAGEVNATAEKKHKGVNLPGPPTRVVLLRNMVGPGEVDDELEDEVASECSKYGSVTSVLIYEIIEQDYSPTEAVRIFVQFERPEQAAKALVDLDGRFFGGRVVRAIFYDEDRFAKNELAPLAGEMN